MGRYNIVSTKRGVKNPKSVAMFLKIAFNKGGHEAYIGNFKDIF